MARNIMGRRLALYPFGLGLGGSLCGPCIRAIHLHIPLHEAIDHLLPCLLVTPSTCPVHQLPCVTIEGFPHPPFLALVLEVIPPQGGGEHIAVTAEPGAKTTLDIETREWDSGVQQFMARVQRRRPWWQR